MVTSVKYQPTGWRQLHSNAASLPLSLSSLFQRSFTEVDSAGTMSHDFEGPLCREQRASRSRPNDLV